jgi:aldehyde:ferredoxin oxidoreductase
VKYNLVGSGEPDVAGVVANEILHIGGFCVFSEFGLSPGAHVGLINAVTGFDYSEEDSVNLGKRSFIMRHAFNLREGLRRKDWTLSDRARGLPPLEAGPLEGVTIDDDLLANNFFETFGFDQDSVPLQETLDQVGGLDAVKRDLYPNS